MDRHTRRTKRFVPNVLKETKLKYTMWIRIRAVIIEDEPLAAQYLAGLLELHLPGRKSSEPPPRVLRPGLRFFAPSCDRTRSFVHISLPGKDGVSLAKAICHASAGATFGFYDGRREPRHRRLPAGGGGLSLEALGSGASHGGGQPPAGISAAL